MKYHFVPVSSNRKTGPIPVTYTERASCPPSCPHYRADCYAEDFYTRLAWDKVPTRGGTLDQLCASIAALREIVRANRWRRGFTYTHKKSPEALEWAGHATAWGFTVNLSADDAGDADALAPFGPVVCIVPTDTPEKTYTPEGRTIIVCPAQSREDITCATCGLCARADRAVIVGFRAHGTRARVADAKARRVIPIAPLKG
jgi:hypothetical protein